MITHILVGVDGSAASRHAAHQALALAEQLKAKVTLLFVLETPPVLPVGPLSGYVVTAPARTPEDIERARRELAELVAERPGVVCERRVETGPHAAETLCDFAGKQSVDLLVVGARGRNAGARWLLGSTSDRVVHHAPCPVMVVRDGHPQG